MVVGPYRRNEVIKRLYKLRKKLYSILLARMQSLYKTKVFPVLSLLYTHTRGTWL